MTYSGPARRVSEPGRKTLADTVTIDHDWALRFSAEDMLIEAADRLSDEDLEGAYLLAEHLRGAIACVQIRRDMARDAARRGEVTA